MMNPLNAHQTTHIAPLARIYGGTLDPCDQQLFSLFQDFERHRALSSAPSFNHWNAAFSGASSSLLDALTSLNPGMAMRTCTSFSYEAVFRGEEMGSLGAEMREYDPRFVVSLLSTVLAGDTSQLTHLDWVSILRTNAVSIALRSIASRDEKLREMAFQSLFALGHSLKV